MTLASLPDAPEPQGGPPRVNPWGLDLALGALGLLVALPSLVWPLGRDQGLYHYIGREWFLYGRLPYRDLFDVKTPGIYALYGAAAWLSGERMWAVRAFDIVGAASLGLVCASVATLRDEPTPRGLRGLSVFAVCLLYFGFFDYWNTAQCELWSTLLAGVAIATSRHHRRLSSAALLAGLLAGIALVFKPPSVYVSAFALLELCVRARRERPGSMLRSLAAPTLLFIGGGAAVGAALLGYFASRGALAALYDVLIVNNRHYVLRGRWVHGFADLYERSAGAWHHFDPIPTALAHALAIAAFFAHRRGDKVAQRRILYCVGLALAGYLSVLTQMKFVWYHWGVLLLAGGVSVATLTRALVPASPLAPSVTTRLVALHLALLYALSGGALKTWRPTVVVAKYKLGLLSRDVMLGSFDDRFNRYSFRETEAIGIWIRAHSLPADTIAVRGFEPQIYLVARRSYPGRFFWTTFLRTPEWAYRMNDWVREDKAVFERTPPRYVITLDVARTGVDSVEYFTEFGYAPVHRLNGYTILERTPRSE